MKKHTSLATWLIVAIVLITSILPSATHVARGQDDSVIPAELLTGDTQPELQPVVGAVAPTGKTCLLITSGNPELMGCEQAHAESRRRRTAKASEEAAGRIAAAWKDAPEGTKTISISEDGSLVFSTHGVFFPAVTFSPTPEGEPIPTPIGVTRPVRESVDTEIRWFDDSSSAGWMFVVGLGLLADDATVIGIIDDPVAIALIATGTGIYVYEAVRVNYAGSSAFYGFGGFSMGVADQYTQLTAGPIPGEPHMSYVAQGGMDVAVIRQYGDIHTPTDGRWVKELALVELRPVREFVLDITQLDGVHVYTIDIYHSEGAEWKPSLAVAWDFAMQRATNAPLASSGIDANWWFSRDHYESPFVEAGVQASEIWQRGDGHANGSIQLWAGVNEEKLAVIGGVHIHSTYVNYIAFKVPVQVGPGQGLSRLGQSKYYYSRKLLQWSCSWTMSTVIGHERHPESTWLTVGQGLARWEETKALYNLTIPVTVLYTPW